MAKINNINNKTESLEIDSDIGSDSFLQFSIGGTPEFIIGVDDTDTTLKIAIGSSLGTSDVFKIDSTGIRTLPLQPSFCAYQSSTASDVTGDNFTHNIICDTEVWDTNSDYDTTTGYFTAPASATYMFVATVSLEQITATHEGAFFAMSATGRVVRGVTYNNASGTGMLTSGGTLIATAIIQMDAADTCRPNIRVFGGTATVDVFGSGSGDLDTSFAGYLLG